MLLGFLIGTLSFVLFLMGHILYFFLSIPKNRARIILNFLKGALLLQTILIVVFFSLETYIPPAYVRGGFWLGILWSYLTFFSLFVLYMPFYYTITTSLSIQTLILIKRAENPEFLIRELREKFVSLNLVEKRLKKMVENEYLTYKNENYFLTTKGQLIARIFQKIKDFWKLGKGG